MVIDKLCTISLSYFVTLYLMSRKCNKTFLQMKNSPTTVKTEEFKNCILTCSLLNTKYVFDFWNWTDNYAQCVQKILPHFEAKDILPVQYLTVKCIQYWLVLENYLFIDNQRYFFLMIGHSFWIFIWAWHILQWFLEISFNQRK